MNNLMKNGYALRLMIAVICCAVLSLVLESASSFAASPSFPAASQETLRLGERIYRDGILPSGEPLRASLKGGVSAPGTTFACISCHLRSGLGSLNENIVIPPINGAKLFKPLQIYSSARNIAQPFKPRVVVDQKLKYYLSNQRRPVYTDKSLADALRDGIDSAGRIMNDVMPRYLLDDENMKILISYLRSLSSEYSPGVSDTAIRFATIITDDVSPEGQNAMLIPLENFIRNKNLTNFLDPRGGSRSRSEGIRSRSTGVRSRIMAETSYDMRGVAIRKLSLSRWVLKGSPETWRAQLEEYYRKEPVFALLGGITNGEWEPIHQFCEENHIPGIFPITDFPVISQTDWYTLYLSKGYYQEGEGAARFLNEKTELMGKPIVQIVRDTREGRALARGFQETWRDSEQKMPVTVILKAGETMTAEFLQQKVIQEKPAAIILWDGPESLKTLEILSAMKNRPAMVLASSSFLGKSMFSLNEKVRGFTYMTYPYGMSQSPEEKSQYLMVPLKKFNPEANAVVMARISQQTYILTLVMDMALVEMRGDYYRDNLLDVIGTIMDLDVPLYDRLSFGPGQRYGSKGCHIVQLLKNGRIEKSGWMSGWSTQ
jgi:hypothetical protein